MKNMTLNFPFLFILLTGLSLLLFLNSYGIDDGENCNYETMHNSISVGEIFNSDIFTYDNRKITLSENEKYVIVLKNNRYCNDCFVTLNNYIRNIKNSLNTKFINITLIDSTTLDRKRNYTLNKNLLADFDEYFFQYNHSSTETIFQRLNTNYTPEIILVNKGNIFYISCSDIFDSRSGDISVKTQFKIFQFFK